MLTSGATDNSTTQSELLDTMGRHRTIQNIEQRYRYFVQDYKNTNVNEKELSFIMMILNGLEWLLIF